MKYNTSHLFHSLSHSHKGEFLELPSSVLTKKILKIILKPPTSRTTAPYETLIICDSLIEMLCH